MTTNYIPQMRPLFGKEEKQEILNYLEEDGFFTEYKKTEQFEKAIAEFTGSKHCVVVNNGTVSLTLAALALGIGPGDEVIVPNYTMIATPNSIKMIGAAPVFVDVEEETLIADIQEIERKITSRTKAIMLVSANGREPKIGIKEYVKLSEKLGIPIIEDAAQSIGSYYSTGKHIGREGAIGSFSFSAPKLISTGQGGALITDNDHLVDKLRKLKDFGRENGGTDVHDTIGYNFKFTEFQACVGIAQMRKLPQRIIRKKEIWKKYQEGLKGIRQIKLFNTDTSINCPWFIDAITENRDELVEYLKSRNIGTRVMYPPINEQNCYRLKGDFNISKMIGKKGIWLPSQIQLTDDEISYITENISSFFKI